MKKRNRRHRKEQIALCHVLGRLRAIVSYLGDNTSPYTREVSIESLESAIRYMEDIRGKSEYR